MLIMLISEEPSLVSNCDIITEFSTVMLYFGTCCAQDCILQKIYAKSFICTFFLHNMKTKDGFYFASENMGKLGVNLHP